MAHVGDVMEVVNFAFAYDTGLHDVFFILYYTKNLTDLYCFQINIIFLRCMNVLSATIGGLLIPPACCLSPLLV